MYNRKVRVQKNWLIGLSIVLCLIFFSAEEILAKKYGLGDIPLDPEVYQRHLKIAPDRTFEALSPAYDARSEGIVTSAKNQGSCGSCWAFASVGAMESHMLKSFGFGPTDLSEQQQVSCNTSMSGCDGGSSTAIKYWEPKGPLNESCFSYTYNDDTPCMEGLCEQLGYRVVNWHTVPVTTGDFKTSLFNDGPSYWRFNVYSDFYNYWNYGNPGDVYVNTPGSTYMGGHAVLLIGWDDSKGAYLCKNSWGTNTGPNGDGTFWIAYSGHTNNLGFGMVNFSLTIETLCGDSICDAEEHCICPDDCGDPPYSEDDCYNGLDNDCDGCLDGADSDCGGKEKNCTGNNDDDCDGLVDCDDPDCSDDSACICDNDYICEEGEDCHNCPLDCIGEDVMGCNNNDVCEPLKGEDCHTCPSDCRGVLTGKLSGRYCCGDTHDTQSCDDPNCTSEGWQCIMEESYCCGDGICEGKEESGNCAIDCVCSNDVDCEVYNDNSICCSGECNEPVCRTDTDCGDAEDCTIDKCQNAGTCGARCENTWPACGAADGCCGLECSFENDPDCIGCSYCLGGACDGKCHPVKEGPECLDCATGQ